MDPITAFQVAASVITFIDFSRRLVSGTYTLYKSPTGQTAQAVQLSTMGNDLKHVRNQMERTIATFPTTEVDREILNLCQQCQAIGVTLQAAIDGLTARGKTKLNFAKSSFVVAAKELLKGSKASELNEELDIIRSRIMFHMIASIWHDTKIGGQSDGNIHDKLDTITKEIGTEMSAVATKIRQEIRQLKSPADEPKVSPRQRYTAAAKRQRLIENVWKSDWDPGTLYTDLRPSHSSEPIERAIMRSLAFKGMDDRGDLVAEAYAKTFDWIFHRVSNVSADETAASDDESTGFAEWLEAENTSIYWITGKPGSGKSTLVKYITTHPELSSLLATWAGRLSVEPLVAGYYFWDAGSNPLQKSRDGLMRTLLYQCLSQRVDLIPKITPRRWALHSVLGEELFTPPQWTWEELSQAFALLAARSGHDFRLGLFIDGLDEFDGDPKDIVDLVKSINLEHNVKICVASRPWTMFADALAESPSLTMQTLTQNDISTYVHGHFESCRAYRELEDVFPGPTAALAEDIVLRAEGVFLWVYIVVRSLKEDMEDGESLSQLQANLKSLPEDIAGLYSKIWQRIQQRRIPISEQLLQIKMAAIDIISLDASLMWLALGETLPKGPDAHEIIRPILARKLDNLTRGFLEISSSGSVEFMHRTAHDWAKQSDVWKRPDSSADLSAEGASNFDPSLALLRAANIYIAPKISKKFGRLFKGLGGLADSHQPSDWVLIAQVLTLAGNVADRPENASRLTETLDEFERIVAGKGDPAKYSRSHWSVKSPWHRDGVLYRGEPWPKTLQYPTYKNCFVGVAASFAIIPYVREKIARHPKLLRPRHRQHRLSLLESAICGWNRNYQLGRDPILDTTTQDLLSQVCRGRRIEMIRFLLDAGGCLEMRAYLAPPRIISIRDQVKKLDGESRESWEEGEEFARHRRKHWGDALELVQSQRVAPMAYLLSQCQMMTIRAILKADLWGSRFL